MGSLAIRPARRTLHNLVDVPGSKSLTNRALLVAALADGTSRLSNVLVAKDSRLMVDGLRALGISVGMDEVARTATIHGTGGHIPFDSADLFCGNSGTTIRFLTAICSLGMGTYRLHGSERMHERPIGTLVDALRTLGGHYEFTNRDGYPPLIVHGRGLQAGRIVFDSPPSSQMVSALLMAAPYAAGDVFAAIRGACPSRPFIDMTRSVMKAFGVQVIDSATVSTPAESESHPQAPRWIVPAPQRYVGANYAIEPDATNASYFFAAAAAVGGCVTVRGLSKTSVQGDVRFVDVLERMGCTVTQTAAGLTVAGPAATSKLEGIDVDLGDMPDTAQTLAVLALVARSPTRIRNVVNLRLKETDRLAALACELRRLGGRVEVHDDGLTIGPPSQIRPARVSTYDDHRMAMSFALAGLVVEGVVIDQPECVAKTFPEFFTRWASLVEP
ncbi:MAG: 3-phosphoshikimate 1-carboxyvinyltransferase [Planctomycetes bacterium]|nr:3-phosphoshikimate 1-carboxyvinyltransferase [Planctomycetota bacterium]